MLKGSVAEMPVLESSGIGIAAPQGDLRAEPAAVLALRMSHPMDCWPPRKRKGNKQLTQVLGEHELHNMHSSNVQAPFQEPDREPVKHQTLHPS